jgi:hypothetical protein
VLAEGLYRLIHQGVNVTEATGTYWRDALEQRFQFIDGIATRLLRGEAADPLTRGALNSLAAARERLTSISPLECVSFIQAWRSALGIWRDRLPALPVLGDPVDAAKFLGLPPQESWLNA